MRYNRLEDKAEKVLIQFEIGTGAEIEEKLTNMQALWKNICGASGEHRERIDKAMFHFNTFESSVLNHEAFLQSQQSHFNYIQVCTRT